MFRSKKVEVRTAVAVWIQFELKCGCEKKIQAFYFLSQS